MVVARKFCCMLLAVSLVVASAAWADTTAPVLNAATQGNLVTLTWSEVAGATGYRLYYAPYPTAEPIGYFDLPAAATVSAELWEGAAFYVAIQVLTAEGAGGLSNIAWFLTWQSAPATGIFDMHTHASPNEQSASASGLVSRLDGYGVGLSVIMPPPGVSTMQGNDTAEQLLAFASASPGRFRVMYGGAELNPLLNAIGHGGTFTYDDLYPNGSTGEIPGEVEAMNAIVADPETWKAEFRRRATEAAQSGRYIGFGELGALHYSMTMGHPYISYPANHELMLWLADLAAEYGMVIDLHMELTDTTRVELEELLAHNRNTKIVWQHAGWSNTGEATGEVLAELMRDHPNLYYTVKLRSFSTPERSQAYPFSGTMLRSSWVTLLHSYGDRMMLGTDSKYFGSDTDADTDDYFERVETFLGAVESNVDSAVRQMLERGTARALFGL